MFRKFKELRSRFIQNKYFDNNGNINDGVYKVSPPSGKDYLGEAIIASDFVGNWEDDYIIPSKQWIIYNQKQTPMCVAFASKRVMEHMEAKEHTQYTPMSAGFIYRNRAGGDLMHMFNTGGMVTREAVAHLAQEGTCAESIYDWRGDWRNLSDIEKDNPIDATLYPLAYYKAKNYFQLSNDIGMMSHLKTNKTGILFVIPVTEKFKGGINEQVDDLQWAKENARGYHAMTIEGWKTINGQKYWMVANSWGSAWGDKGYCYLPFGYAISEAWALINNVNNPSYYHVQIGAFGNKENAKKLRDKLVAWKFPTYIVSMWNEEYQKVLHKVQVGAYYYRSNALAMKNKVESDERVQAENVGTWIVKY